MTKYVVVYLPKKITNNQAHDLTELWTTHLYNCGALELSIEDFYSIGKKKVAIFKIKTHLICWYPEWLNAPHSPNGIACYMSKKQYYKLKEEIML